MNKYYISHSSAHLIYQSLRAQQSKIDFTICNNANLSSSDSIQFADFKSVITNSNLNIDLDFHFELLSRNLSAHRHNSNLWVHFCSGKLPKKSFLKISEQLFIVIPELMFCQMAQHLNYENLFLQGMEICGTYCVLETQHPSFVSNIKPLTSPKKILSYMLRLQKESPSFPQIRKAIDVAKYLVDGSASPQESRLYIKLCAPRKCGGYGIKNMKMNKAASLSAEAMRICGQKKIIPDISNAKRKIAIEYDSQSFHENLTQNRRDKLRLDAFVHDGWRVFSFVDVQMNNLTSFHNTAIAILRANNQNSRIRSFNFVRKRNSLFKNLIY